MRGRNCGEWITEQGQALHPIFKEPMPDKIKMTIVRAFMEKSIGPGGVVTLRPLRIVDVDPGEEVELSQAKLITGIKIRTLQRMCEEGDLKTAYKPRNKRYSRWKVQVTELLSLREESAV